MSFTFPIHQVVFFAFSAVLIIAAMMVVMVRNPVHSVLFLVLCFFASAVLWMTLQAEFLSLVLIFVYVGAVMTLFLFVVMMLNVDLSAMKEGFVKYMPLGLLVAVLLIGTMFFVIGPTHFKEGATLPTHYASTYSNVKAMGGLLYSHYLYPFEVASLILLVAIVAAIALAYHGRRPDNKSQKVSEQLSVTKKDRLRIVDIKADKS
ncbi:MAG: NADH-quinone oxidoreductase subunit J [Coxiellaceae bacterium]|nr:NADH-quinone oxidoreductase subunit J [Coxiellaceae bacterium]